MTPRVGQSKKAPFVERVCFFHHNDLQNALEDQVLKRS